MPFLLPAAAGAAALGGTAATAATLGTAAAAAGTATAAATTGALAGSALAGGAGLSSLIGGAALPGVTSALGAGTAAGLGGLGAAGAGLGATAAGTGLSSALAGGALGGAAIPGVTSALSGAGATGLGALASSAAPMASAPLLGGVEAAKMGIAANAPSMAGINAANSAYAANAANAANSATQAANALTNPLFDLSAGAKSGTGLQMPVRPEVGLNAPSTALTPEKFTHSPIVKGQSAFSNAINLIKDPSLQGVKDFAVEHPFTTAGLGYTLYDAMKDKSPKAPKDSPGMVRPYTFERTVNPGVFDSTYSNPLADTSEKRYFTEKFTALEPYEAPGPEYKKAAGGPVEAMSAQNNAFMMANDPDMPRMAAGGLGALHSHLGSYSDGGRLLRGPGDGVSDSIPAVIGDKQPARLADGEFVVPARIVSEIGNGSTEAGARKLYAMMDRVQRARKKTTGKNAVAKDTKAEKLLPA